MAAANTQWDWSLCWNSLASRCRRFLHLSFSPFQISMHRSELTIPWMTQVECLFAGFKGEEPFYRPPVHGVRPSDSTELTQNWSDSLWMLLKGLRRYTVRSLYCSTMFYTHDLDTSLIIIITSICHALYVFKCGPIILSKSCPGILVI